MAQNATSKKIKAMDNFFINSLLFLLVMISLRFVTEGNDGESTQDGILGRKEGFSLVLHVDLICQEQGVPHWTKAGGIAARKPTR
jgi:hypothetical protein